MRLAGPMRRVRRGLVAIVVVSVLGLIGPSAAVAAAAPLPTLRPTGDGSRDATIQIRGVTLAYDAIDDPIGSADTTSYLQNAQRTAGRYVALLTDLPADFGAMSSLTISIRARTVGRTDDQTMLYAGLVGADETTPLSSEVLVATNPGTSAWATVANVALSGLTPGSKAIWDGARLRLRWTYLQVGSADATQLRLTATELHGTYLTGGPPPPDLGPPNLVSAAVNGATLGLTYDEPLDGGSSPAPGDFAVLVGGSPRPVGSVAIGGPTVTLGLASPVVAGEVVTLSYSVPVSNPIQDVAGNDAPGFSGQAVANGTPGGVTGTLPSFSHVYVIVLENKSIGQVIGSSSAPYLNSLADRYGLATAWSAISHPSQPNYIAMLSGSTQGVTSNSTVDLPGRSLADQIEEAGLTWRVFAENVPTDCFTGSSASGGPDGSGTYERKHEPAISFDRIRTDPVRCANITDFSHFAPGLAAFNLIVPNQCHSMHDCSVAEGDQYMSTFVPRILADPGWSADDLLVIIFDEGVQADQIVATLVISERVPVGFRSAVAHDHFSLLWSIESAWGLPCLNLSCSANTFSEFFPGP